MGAGRAAPMGALAVLALCAASGRADDREAFDCGMRRTAYDFGRRLLPRQGRFESLYYALNLNSPACPTPMAALEDLRAGAPADAAEASPTADAGDLGGVFVDAEAGDDAASGARDAPLRTLHEAVRRATAGEKLVWLRAGQHFLDAPLEFGPRDSGLSLRAFPGEQPVLSGGVRVSAKWEPYDVPGVWEILTDLTLFSYGGSGGSAVVDFGETVDASSCQAACGADHLHTGFTWHDSRHGDRAGSCWCNAGGETSAQSLPGAVSGRRAAGKNIYKASLQGQVSEVPGLQLGGVRATRARYPNLPHGIEVTPEYGCMIGGGQATWTPPQFDRFGPVHYHTDMTPEHSRNETSGGIFSKYMIGVGGLCSVYDPPVSYWCSEHPSGGGAFAFRTPSGFTPNAGAMPNSPYKDPSEMVVNVWRPERWANWMFEVTHYDPTTNNFTFGRGGNQGARGENTGGDFFVENVFEELDAPGEFFFNRTTGDLFLFYNGTGAPPADLEVVVPKLRNLINITGTQWNPVRNVTLDGITFRATRYTYMDPHGVPSAGDWALDRISAVFMQGTEEVTVKNSVFERLDGNAVMISGYNRNTTVQGNDFSYIGGNAIISWGYTNETADSGFPYYTPRTNFPDAGIDGTDGNHPRYNSIVGNMAREVGLYEKQSSFYMQAKTAQSTISGNVFFNGPRAGINYNDGFGGGDELSHNLVFSTCRESGDHGPFNSWDRQPYLTTVRTGEPSLIMQWREIHHNFFIDNYSPQETIDNDDGSCYYKSHHNFLVYGGNGMKNDFGGHDNHQFGNVYAYIGQALSVDSTLPGHEDYFNDNRVVLTGKDVGGPQCGGARTNMSGNQYFTPDGSLTLCGKSLVEAQKDGMDVGSTVGKIPTAETILGWAREVLGMDDTTILVV